MNLLENPPGVVQDALRQTSPIGGTMGAILGDKLGRGIVVRAAGGLEKIRSTCDQSPILLDTMAIYLCAKHPRCEHRPKSLQRATGVCPTMKSQYMRAIRAAPKRTTTETALWAR